MPVEVKMPQLGLTMTEGLVTNWLKSVGDKVAIGDPLFEVETDKINSEIEAQTEGTLLAILVEKGTTAQVRAAVAVIGDPGESVVIAATPVAAAPATPQSAPVAGTSVAAAIIVDGRAKSSPIARRLAREQGIDINQVQGTGPGGRIVERDINAAVASGGSRVGQSAAEPGVELVALVSDQRILSQDVAAARAGKAAAAGNAGTPLSSMRRVIAERMSQSWTTVPHVTFTVEVDMTEAVALRKRLADAIGKKVSFTDILARASATALLEFPYVNSSLIDGKLVLHDDVHIGIAVALDDGLIVPVIRNAATKNVARLGEEIRQLAEKARQGRLGPDEITGGTFTITNLGMYGIDEFTPIINQPESAILGVCRIVERQVVRKGAVEIRPLMNLCLSCDHRIIDGAMAARFLARLRQLIEQPLLMV